MMMGGFRLASPNVSASVYRGAKLHRRYQASLERAAEDTHFSTFLLFRTFIETVEGFQVGAESVHLLRPECCCVPEAPDRMRRSQLTASLFFLAPGSHIPGACRTATWQKLPAGPVLPSSIARAAASAPSPTTSERSTSSRSFV